MYKIKTQPAFQVNERDERRKDFKQKAANLLTRIQAVHNEVSESKLGRLKKFLSDINNIEEGIDTEIREKKQMFEKLLAQINQLNQQIQQESHASEKMKIQIKSRIDIFIRTNQKAFEKIKADRVEAHERIQIYLNEKIQALSKKILLFKSPQNTFSQMRDQLINIKKQVVSFFEEAERSEQKTKKQIFTAIEQCGNMINDKQIESAENDAMEQMRIIQAEIQARVYILAEERQRMQEEVIKLLQKVQQAMI